MPIVRMDQRVQPMTRQRKERPVIRFSTNAEKNCHAQKEARQHGEPLSAKGSVCRQSLRNVSH